MITYQPILCDSDDLLRVDETKAKVVAVPIACRVLGPRTDVGVKCYLSEDENTLN
jgi:hypothetical protein